MSEATITIAKVFTAEGTGKRGKWTRYDIKSEEEPDERFKTFNEDIGKLAQQHEGSGAQFKAKWEDGQYGRDLKELAGPVAGENGSSPAPTQRAKTATDDQTAINARKALEEAVKAMPHFKTEPKSSGYTALAGFFFEFLQEKCSPAEPEPEVDPDAASIPF